MPTTHDGRVSSAQLCAGEAAGCAAAAEPLDLRDAAVLILRAERHEDRAEQRERDADQQRRGSGIRRPACRRRPGVRHAVNTTFRP